mmetsp:Transcript_54465/g.173064  ORF Transcript_54465/g.173064 Transcript_54465/m.173064 type:complete len:240 (-) Transcript_54465:487-1206(-)
MPVDAPGRRGRGARCHGRHGRLPHGGPCPHAAGPTRIGGVGGGVLPPSRVGAGGDDVPDLPPGLLRRSHVQRRNGPRDPSPREAARLLRLHAGARGGRHLLLPPLRERDPRLRHNGLLQDRPAPWGCCALQRDRQGAARPGHPRGAGRGVQPHGAHALRLPGHQGQGPCPVGVFQLVPRGRALQGPPGVVQPRAQRGRRGVLLRLLGGPRPPAEAGARRAGGAGAHLRGRAVLAGGNWM